jgi:hypothetical protein
VFDLTQKQAPSAGWCLFLRVLHKWFAGTFKPMKRMRLQGAQSRCSATLLLCSCNFTSRDGLCAKNHNYENQFTFRSLPGAVVYVLGHAAVLRPAGIRAESKSGEG